MRTEHLLKLGTLSPWGHALIWLVIQIALISCLGTLIIFILWELTGKDMAAETRAEGWYVLWSTFTVLVTLLVIRRRYLFLPKDLINYVDANDGISVLKDRTVKAQIGNLAIHAYFDRPFKDYWPHPRASEIHRERGRSRVIQEGGFHPRYMLSMSEVQIIWPGDLALVEEVCLELRPGQQNMELTRTTGNEFIDQALIDSSSHIKVRDFVISVVIDRKSLRMRFKGGTWLGRKFGERIAESVEFARRVTEKLSHRYKQLNSDSWNVTDSLR